MYFNFKLIFIVISRSIVIHSHLASPSLIVISPAS